MSGGLAGELFATAANTLDSYHCKSKQCLCLYVYIGVVKLRLDYYLKGLVFMSVAKAKFVRLNDEDHQQLKQIAADTKQPIQAIVELAVSRFLRKPARGAIARK